MDGYRKKQSIKLGIRICLVFLTALCILIAAAYFALSKNVHQSLSDYSIKLVQVMVKQGVTTVEYELRAGKEEAAVLADSLKVPSSPDQAFEFPDRAMAEPDEIRMVYVSKDAATGRTVTSDGRQRDISRRQDIITAFGGEAAVYGPYYNEEREYVVCYSAPVKRNGKVVGVFGIEKDGYRFCELIESIRFVDSGECYIINWEGTDIAVSNLEHIDWVENEYNARKLLEAQEDPVTRSVMELEERGLNGESGVGMYYWEGSACYVVYEPISSTGWVMLAGMREEEVAAMTQSTLLSSILKVPALGICLGIFALLTGLIIYWIISDTKKNAEINDKLEMIANHDALTGLLNRRFLETNLLELWKYPIKVSSQAAVFMMDIDNFKNYNDCFGHPKGDACLRHMANVLKMVFEHCEGDVIRYGGEEFIAVIFSVDRQTAEELGKKICCVAEGEKIPNGQGGVVTVSVGVCHVETTSDYTLNECIAIADKALYQAKDSGKNRAVLYCPCDSPPSQV